MAPNNPRFNDTTSYSEQVKLTRVFGAPTLTAIRNHFVMVENKESYDSNGYPRLHTAPPENEPEADPLYAIETTDPAVRPTFRDVQVYGKTDYSSILMELQGCATGLLVLMQRSLNNEHWINLRFLPDSKVMNIIDGSSSGQSNSLPMIKIPNSGFFKLNVTSWPTALGETKYKTHSTAISIENMTEVTSLNIKEALEFHLAELVAHYDGQQLSEFSSFVQPPSEESMNAATIQERITLCFLYGALICQLIPVSIGGSDGNARRAAWSGWLSNIFYKNW